MPWIKRHHQSMAFGRGLIQALVKKLTSYCVVSIHESLNSCGCPDMSYICRWVGSAGSDPSRHHPRSTHVQSGHLTPSLDKTIRQTKVSSVVLELCCFLDAICFCNLVLCIGQTQPTVFAFSFLAGTHLIRFAGLPP